MKSNGFQAREEEQAMRVEALIFAEGRSEVRLATDGKSAKALGVVLLLLGG